jgi:hypothetical protein
MSSEPDPILVIAPGALRDSIAYVIEGYYEGGFPPRHYKSAAMRKWCGTRANSRGTKFAQQVAERVQVHGWYSMKTEVQMTELLGIGRDEEFGEVKQFGDVDVFAWNRSRDRVLIMECKRLHFHKAPGEIVEQLSDYRGRLNRDGKPDDLSKHLRRIEILRARKELWFPKLGLCEDAAVEGWIIFKNPVPMLFAWKDFETRTRIATFADLAQILNQ